MLKHRQRYGIEIDCRGFCVNDIEYSQIDLQRTPYRPGSYQSLGKLKATPTLGPFWYHRAKSTKFKWAGKRQACPDRLIVCSVSTEELSVS